jgi:UDP-N-acetyl-2-amino-2-deoxyglucuronate dehydrogenase
MVAHVPWAAEDACQVFVEFASEAWGLIETTTTVWGGLGRAIELHGTRGTISMFDGEIGAWRFADDEPATATATDRDAVTRSPWEPALPEDRPHNIIEDVVAALTRGAPLACPPEEGRKAVAILEAVYRSARRGGAEEAVER